MYSITEHCDCLNRAQSPLLQEDIGFLVGKNPFAIDKLASELLTSRLDESKTKVYQTAFQSSGIVASYVREKYAIACEGPLRTVKIR
jgi:uncharacterized Fe-S center protein